MSISSEEFLIIEDKIDRYKKEIEKELKKGDKADHEKIEKNWDSICQERKKTGSFGNYDFHHAADYMESRGKYGKAAEYLSEYNKRDKAKREGRIYISDESPKQAVVHESRKQTVEGLVSSDERDSLRLKALWGSQKKDIKADNDKPLGLDFDKDIDPLTGIDLSVNAHEAPDSAGKQTEHAGQKIYPWRGSEESNKPRNSPPRGPFVITR